MFSDDRFQASHTPFDFTKYDNPYEIIRVDILKELIPQGQGRKAIDIGCGPSYFSRELAGRGWMTTAIDSDGDNIKSAGNYAQETHLGDASGILSKLKDNQYDLVLALEIIEHMPKPIGMNLLSEIRRVLRPGGNLILSTPNRHSPEGLGAFYWSEKIRGHGKWTAWEPTHVHIYSSSEILRLLKAGGFAVDGITGYHYEGKLPVIGRWRLPLVKSTKYPFNRMGFNIIIKCRKR